MNWQPTTSAFANGTRTTLANRCVQMHENWNVFCRKWENKKIEQQKYTHTKSETIASTSSFIEDIYYCCVTWKMLWSRDELQSRISPINCLWVELFSGPLTNVLCMHTALVSACVLWFVMLVIFLYTTYNFNVVSYFAGLLTFTLNLLNLR